MTADRSGSRRRVALACALALAWALAGAASPAEAAGCKPAGGSKVPEASPLPGNWQIQGHGWGHGLGMSQFGAQGAALLGCSAAEILTTYYTGIAVSAADSAKSITIGLWPESPSGSPAEVLNVKAYDDAIPWQVLDGAGNVHTVLSTQAKGTQRTVRIGTDYKFTITEGDGDTPIWDGGGMGWMVQVPHNGNIIQLPSKSTNGQWPGGRPYRWGTLQLRSVQHAGKAGMFVTTKIGSIDRYLRGLAEMPSSWEPEALKAQAITGRSYALDRRDRVGVKSFCGCHLYDSPADQAYSAYLKESESSGGTNYGARWVSAVDSTVGKVMRYDGQIATGFYSSSHAGRTLSAKFVWGSDVPWIQPIDDSRWEMASPNKPHLRSWAAGVTSPDLGAEFGVGIATRVQVLSDGVRITGTTGDKVITGWDFRQGLGLLSPVFKVNEYPIHQLVGRIGGLDRIDTAVRVSSSYWKSSEHAVLATAGDFPDALAAGSLVAKLGAPLLLTSSTELSSQVSSELHRLGVKKVWLLGGTAAISQGIEDQLANAGYQVQRLAGTGRVETAAAVATEVGPADSGEVTLVLADNWPDAVAAGAFAATPDVPPTLLTGKDGVPKPTADTLKALGATHVLLLGGTAAVSAEVEESLKGLGYEVRRLAGTSRYDTSVAVASEALSRLEGEVPIVLASGANFPDALAAGALSAKLGAPLLLVPRENLNAIVGPRTFLETQPLTEGIIIGGTAAVTDEVLQQAEAALEK
ncbi:MAG TPA: cell wall-binding repeat-containing protein [Egibacteraceae bacterium]|nr:cell wall-binding repeat-containing protein [Egibacteraceae bacterium]